MPLTKQEIKDAVKETLNEEVKAFYVDRERHWDDHNFIGEFRGWLRETRSIVWKSIVGIVVIGITGLIILGFAVWKG